MRCDELMSLWKRLLYLLLSFFLFIIFPNMLEQIFREFGILAHFTISDILWKAK